MKKSDREQRTVKKAREIAKSGRHIGWWYVASELQFQGGDPQAIKILEQEPIRSELDRLCQQSLKRTRNVS